MNEFEVGFFDWEFFATCLWELPWAEELTPGMELEITLGFMLASVLCLL